MVANACILPQSTLYALYVVQNPENCCTEWSITNENLSLHFTDVLMHSSNRIIVTSAIAAGQRHQLMVP